MPLHITPTRIGKWVPGLIIATLLAWISLELAAIPLFHDRLHFGALLIVILLGIIWRAIAPVPHWALPGVEAAKRPILRLAVGGLGLRLSLGEIAEIGGPALVIVSVSTLAALFGGWWICRRLGLSRDLGLLLGVGGAVCGASAVVAADTVVQGERRDSALAISVITLLGTLGILIYPELSILLGMDQFNFGVWAGASLHETAQVVAAGDSIGPEAKSVATVVKLVRICWLAPTVFYLGYTSRKFRRGDRRIKVAPVPWFLVLFVILAALNSADLLPPQLLAALKRGGSWLMCIGMAGVGLQTDIRDLAHAGFAPLLAGALQWILLALVSLLMITLIL